MVYRDAKTRYEMRVQLLSFLTRSSIVIMLLPLIVLGAESSRTFRGFHLLNHP